MQSSLVHPKPLVRPIPEITRQDQFIVDDEPWLRSSKIPGGLSFTHALEPWRGPLKLSHDQIFRYIESGKAWIKEGAENPNVKALELVFGDKKFSEFSSDDQIRARMRQAAFELYDEECLLKGHISRSGPNFKKWIEDNWAPTAKRARCDVVISQAGCLTVSTFNRTYRTYLASNRNILSLMPKYTGPGRKTVCWTPEAYDFAVRIAREYMSRLKPTKARLFAEYKALLSVENENREDDDQLYGVSKTTFSEIIASFPAFEVMAAREGEAYALKYFAPNLRSYNVILPGRRVEIDEWKGDLLTFYSRAGALEHTTPEQRAKLRKIRLWIVFAIDAATRYVLAAKVAQSPNTEAALGMLRLIMSDKTSISDVAGAKNPWIGRCKPRLLASDHGSAFRSDAVVDAANALHIAAVRPQTGMPKKRPFIESLFHTLGPYLTAFIDGKTFRNIFEKRDYDPKKHVSLAAGEFAEIVVQVINDHYHLSRHGSLGGQCPHDAWVDAIETYDVPVAPHSREILRAFGKIYAGPVTKYGIIKHNVPYLDERLATDALDRRDFEYIFDESCINSILVKTKDGGWYEVENTIDLVDDLALSEWDEANKEFLAQNRAKTDEKYLIVRDIILRNRANGKAATARAGLDPAIPSAAKLEKMRRKIYTGVASGQTTGLPVNTSVPVLPPPDELRGGTIGRAKPPALQPAPEPKDRPISNFKRQKWED